MVIIADLFEQMLAESRALNGFQELFGDDQIGINVDALKGGGDALQNVKRLHGDKESLMVYRPLPYPKSDKTQPKKRFLSNIPDSRPPS